GIQWPVSPLGLGREQVLSSSDCLAAGSTTPQSLRSVSASLVDHVSLRWQLVRIAITAAIRRKLCLIRDYPPNDPGQRRRPRHPGQSLAAAAAVRCTQFVRRRVRFRLQRPLHLLIQTPRSPEYAGPASILT